MPVLSAESVCIGHPDKLCDLIADTVLDAALLVDENAHVAVEVMAVGHRIIVAGEITASAKVGVKNAVRSALAQAGYNPLTYRIYNYVRSQSLDIFDGVTTSLEARSGQTDALSSQGAGDQGTVYGYATDETPQRLPLPLVLAQNICHRLETLREDGVVTGLGPDGKAQVSIEYNDKDQPVRVSAVVVSVQHDKTKDPDELAREIRSQAIEVVCDTAGYPIDEGTEVYVNPSGRFIVGGPEADTGVTGRKLMVDTYGGLAPHGGGAFSGKDPSKVDRSGAYMARFIARALVDSGLAHRATVAISYAIGKAHPLALSVNTHGTSKYTDEELTRAVGVVFDLRPAAIIKKLGLKTGWFYGTCVRHNHFNYSLFPWEYTQEEAIALLKEVRGED